MNVSGQECPFLVSFPRSWLAKPAISGRLRLLLPYRLLLAYIRPGIEIEHISAYYVDELILYSVYEIVFFCKMNLNSYVYELVSIRV